MFLKAYSDTRKKWFVVTDSGHLAHVDGRAAFFDLESDADQLVETLNTAPTAETVARALPQRPNGL